MSMTGSPAGRAIRCGSSRKRSRAGRAHPGGSEREPVPGGLKPYLHVRANLWAKVTRALFYDLVELGEERDIDGIAQFGVASGGEFFVMAPAASIREFM